MSRVSCWQRADFPALNPVARFTGSLLFTICALLPASGWAQRPVPGAASLIYRISGTVVSSRDHSPVPHVSLTASPVTARGGSSATPQPAIVETDAAGRFTLMVPSAGSFTLEAWGHGFRRQSLDQHEAYSSSVVLTKTDPTVEVNFQIVPDSFLSGYIRDEAGDPLRGAHVALHAVPRLEEPGDDSQQVRGSTMTDDRGFYEFAGLAPGRYRVSVQAEPWYALASGGIRNSSAVAPPLDPALDVVYPLTWYPGTPERAAAALLTLEGGDSRQADIQLLPIASVHLHISAPPSTPDAAGRRPLPSFPQVVPLDRRRMANSPISVRTAPNGDMDVGGLGPGSYEVMVNTSGRSGGQAQAVLNVEPGSPLLLDMKNTSAMAAIKINADGVPRIDPPSVRLINVDSGLEFFAINGNRRFRGGRRTQPGAAAAPSADDTPQSITLEAPPGQYEVFAMTSDPQLYLAGLSATGAEVRGRLLTLRSGDVSLTLHIATGRATVSGFVNFEGKHLQGATVLLVPASFAEVSSLTVLRRDQSNTDGSFDMADVIPGAYILLAIDRGWDVNLSDPSTLARYLQHGTPLDVQPGARLQHLDLDAQAR